MGQDAQCVNQGARWEALAVYTCGAAELACFALDHDQLSAAVSVWRRDIFDAMPAPFDGAPELPGLPAVPLEQLSREREHRNLAPAPRTRALRAGPATFVEPDGWDHRGGILLPPWKQKLNELKA
jgi:hypothetical protein